MSLVYNNEYVPSESILGEKETYTQVEDRVFPLNLFSVGVEALAKLPGGYFKTRFSELPNFRSMVITKRHIQDLLECCIFFETKNDHSQALNTPHLGVTPIYFTSTDIELFYAIFEIDPKAVSQIIAEAGFLNDEWTIVNDPYNQMVVYLAHRIMNELTLSEKYKKTGLITLFKLLHYKFFTSIVYHSYKYGADRNTMEYVISNMSNKFDLIKLGTWKKVIEQRCEDIIAPDSIHYKTIRDYKNDLNIVYVLSDAQSRLRQKIVLVNRLYYEAKEKSNMISDYKLMNEVDGVKLMQATTNSFDQMISMLQMQIQSPTRFLDMEIIKVTTAKFKDLSSEMFKTILTMFCDQAAMQSETPDLPVKKMVKNQKTGEKEVVYTSCNYLISELIQKTYRYCIMNKTNMSSKADILLKVINTYTSSRVVDPDILALKRSFVHFVISCNKTVRTTTIASLALAMIMYLILRSFAVL